MFDYETLRFIWWALLGILLMGFAVMDGFDLGALSLLPFFARNDGERRIVVNAIGPVWEGNQVWLILGAGAMFAAWPYLYAVAFSGFYLAMLMVLGSLILRPVGITFRSKMPDARWRAFWDWCLVIAGTVSPVVFGIAFGNAIEGVPFTFDDTLRVTYKGAFLDLLNPFALLCGAVSLAMIWLQGGAWLALKTNAFVQTRARRVVMICAILTPVLFVLAGLVAGNLIEGYRIIGPVHAAGPSNPLLKTVMRAAGAWMDNYTRMPVTRLAPLLVMIGAGIALAGASARRPLVSFLGSSLVPIGVIGTAGVSMFPFLLPSSLDPNASLTVWDASSSRATLIFMTVATAVFLPLILAYTSWVYHVLRGKVTAAQVKEESDSLY